MDKFVKDDLVAVLVSPGYGAGWYSWSNDESMLFDPGLVQLILKEATFEEKLEYASTRWPDAYVGGLNDVEVEWVPVDTEFMIEERDGSETIAYKIHDGWLRA